MNRQWTLASTPVGPITTAQMRLVEGAIPSLAAGQILVRNRLLPIEAGMTTSMKGSTYRPQLRPGDLIPGLGLAEVIGSDSPDFAIGDIVEAPVGWQEYAALDPKSARKRDRGIPLETSINLLGISGMTAYYGMLGVARVRAGETVLVSAAAGAVGVLAIQIAKIAGCRVVGVAGGPEKCAWLREEFGLDATVDYKAGEVSAALRAACPDGVDVYFDNTAGEVLEAAIENMRIGGRIALCGIVSQVQSEAAAGVRGVPLTLIIRRIAMLGFLLSDFPAADRRTAEQTLLRWRDEGRIKTPMHVVEGFEQAPQALVDLLAGRNRGKAVVRL